MTSDPQYPIYNPDIRPAFTLIEVMVAVVIAAFALTVYLKSAAGLTRLYAHSRQDLARYAVAALPLAVASVPMPMPKTRFDPKGLIERFHIEEDTAVQALQGSDLYYRIVDLGIFGEEPRTKEKENEDESNASATLAVRLFKETVFTPEGAVTWYRLATPETR